MNKKEANNLWPLMKAYSEGAIIEFREKPELSWIEASYPDFLKHNEYRIKPQPKLVPFTFEDNLLFRDKWIRQKDLKALSRLSWFGPISISLGDNNKMTYIQLLDNFEFEDGSPCGKYTNE